jgi:hypothetical protein
MQNRLLTQFNDVITSQWLFKQIEIPYTSLIPRELFELAYHTCNSIATRNIYLKLSSSETTGGSKAILYSNTKKFISIEAMDESLRIIKYYNEGATGDKVITEIKPSLERRKKTFSSKDKNLKIQILKLILVERKIDECMNLVMLKGINRKVYFAIGDARESAAVVPLFMETDGSNLVQLALNKWMEQTQRLEQEQNFPEKLIPGILKNLTQIKRWLLNLISAYLDK